jgi:hypothetical protein
MESPLVEKIVDDLATLTAEGDPSSFVAVTEGESAVEAGPDLSGRVRFAGDHPPAIDERGEGPARHVPDT